MNNLITWFLELSLWLKIYFGFFAFLMVSITTLMTIDSYRGLRRRSVVNVLATLQLILLIAYFPFSAFIFAVLLSIFGERY